MIQSDESGALLIQDPMPIGSQREPFLYFYLQDKVGALLPLERSKEVLKVSRKEIVPVFFMPPWVMGVYNLRGEILWIVDLAHLLGLMPCHDENSSSSFTILVLQATQAKPTSGRAQMLGCIINRLESVEKCSLNEIQPQLIMKHPIPSAFLQGYWFKAETEPLAVLNVNAIVQFASKINHTTG